MSDSSIPDEKKAQLEQFLNIVKIVAGEYIGLYFFNLDEETGFVVSDTKNLQNDTEAMIAKAPDLKVALNMFASSVVHPNDRHLLEAVDYEYVRQTLADSKRHGIVFRRNFGGEYRYSEMVMIKGEPIHERAVNVIVGFVDVDAEYRRARELERKAVEQERTLAERMHVLMASLSDDYECINYVKLSPAPQEDMAELLRMSGDIVRKIPNWSKEKCFTKRLDLLITYGIVPQDSRRFYDSTRRAVIIEHLNKSSAYYVPFRMIIDGDEHHYLMKFSPERDDEGKLIGFVNAIVNNDAVVKSQERVTQLEKAAEENEAFTRLFMDAYDSAYYVNTEDDSYTIYKQDPEIPDIVKRCDKFSEFMTQYIKCGVHPDDRERIRKSCNLNFIRDKLALRGSYTAIFRNVMNDIGYYFRIQYVKGHDDKHIAVGVLNIDDEYRKEQKTQQMLEELVDRRTNELISKNNSLIRVNEGIIDLLGEIVESRDNESGQHIRRVKGFTYILAAQMMKDYPEYGLTERDVNNMSLASALHDIGKIAIPDSILLKPGKLTAEELEVMKTHCERGCEVIRKMSGFWSEEYLNISLDICRSHHEKWDGRGYPMGLKGDEIPIAAQIVSVADAYDALTSKRVYKDAVTPEKAYEMIIKGECGLYSDKILSCLSKCRHLFSSRLVDDSVVPADEALDGINEIMLNDSLEFNDDTLPVIKLLAEQMPGGFFIYRADGNEELLFFNNMMVSYLGCSSSEEFMTYTANSFRGIVCPEDLEDVEKSMSAQLSVSPDKMCHIVYRTKRKDGDVRWFDNYAHFTHSKNYGDVFYVFIIDCTDIYQIRDIEQRLLDVQISNEVLDKVTAIDDDTSVTGGALEGIRVMLVDDDDLSREMNTDILEAEGSIVYGVDNGPAAVELIRQGAEPDVILIDIIMSGQDGIETTKQIRAIEANRDSHLPIIALTADKSDELSKRCILAGIDNIMSKPLEIRDFAGILISSMRESSQVMRKKLADTIKAANTDALTHVKNLAAYSEKSMKLSIEMKRNMNCRFGIVLCDINDLKKENDTYGHDVGNVYIKNCCRIICEVFRNSPVYRIGGDEFVVVLHEPELNDAEELMDELEHRVVAASAITETGLGKASFAAGLAIYDSGTDKSFNDVVKRADKLMYEEKRRMKGLI